MADEQANETQEQANETQEQQLIIQKIYCKDVSFETPNSPEMFTLKWEPELKVDLHTGINTLGKDVFEVVLTVTVTVKVGEKTSFLAEVEQAGIFNITGFEKPQLDHMLGSYCPNILFPYVREVISELVNKGGFPQLILQPVNFDSVYAQHLQERQAQQEEGDSPATDAVH